MRRLFFGIIVAIGSIPVFYLTAMATTPPHCGAGCTLGDLGAPRLLVGVFFGAICFLTGLGLIADQPEGLAGPDPYADVEAIHRSMEQEDG